MAMNKKKHMTLPVILVGGPLSGQAMDVGIISESILLKRKLDNRFLVYNRDGDGLNYFYDEMRTVQLNDLPEFETRELATGMEECDFRPAKGAEDGQ